MISTSLRGAVAAAAVVAASSAFAAANLVADGDFSNPWGGSTFTDYLSGSTFGPWTVTGSGSGPYGSAGVDLIGGYWQAPTSGGGSVDLDGLYPGGIEQTLTLTSGKTYDLSFYLSGNPDGFPTTKSVTVSIGNFDETYTYTLSAGNSHTNMLYQLVTAQFVAGSTNTLSFSSNDGGGSPFGPVVGGVSVAVPEASTWAMVGLGFAGLAFAGYRSRRTAISIA